MPKNSLKTGLMIVNFLAVYRTIQLYLYDFRSAIGPSMIPTIREGGDVLLIDKFSPYWKGYKKNEVVLAKSPMKLNSVLCKRIIALGGEYVEIEGQKYFVPENHVWLEGDNKPQSFDSRDFGPVPLSLLEGRVIYKIWNSLKRL